MDIAHRTLTLVGIRSRLLISTKSIPTPIKATPNQLFAWHGAGPSANERVVMVTSIASRALYMSSVLVAKD